MSHKVTEEILTEIKAAKYFSLVVDSMPDISHAHQLAIIIRYFTKKGIPIKRLLCFLVNVGYKAEGLFNTITAVLNKYDIDIINCRGQLYDNSYHCVGHILDYKLEYEK